MKKLISGIMLAAFVLFGVANVQTVVAEQQAIEIMNFDKEPDKDKDKKDKKAKNAKAANKNMQGPDAKKDCAVKSDCTPVKKSCCSKEHPDKK